MRTTVDRYDRDSALAQIKKCEFQCEGWPLEMNAAWLWLETALSRGPKFLPGQGVYYEIEASVGGNKMRMWAHYYVVAVWLTSTTDARVWRYSLSNDPPAPYHYGETQFRDIDESALRSEVPEDAA